MTWDEILDLPPAILPEIKSGLYLVHYDSERGTQHKVAVRVSGEDRLIEICMWGSWIEVGHVAHNVSIHLNYEYRDINWLDNAMHFLSLNPEQYYAGPVELELVNAD